MRKLVKRAFSPTNKLEESRIDSRKIHGGSSPSEPTINKIEMSITDIIKKRKSVRTYTGEGLSIQQIDEIKNFILQNQAPFGVKARIELIHSKANEKPFKLGTYGFISGASDYLALIYEEDKFAETGAAYLFEQVILFCTGLGLGTCWLGASFNRRNFEKQLSLKSNEKLRIISPIGYDKGKRRFLESLIMPQKTPRKPFNSLFFDKNIETPLTETKAGIYAQPLEMLRLAPSAYNKQPWRVVQDEDVFHFYKETSSSYASVDLGIALCHFEQTCKELNIKGNFTIAEAPGMQSADYCISWFGTHQ